MAAMNEPRPPSDLTYEEAMAELDAILAELDRGQVDVDGLTARLARGVELIEDLDARIRRARDDLDRIAPRLEELGRAGEP
jgi:exodeoxyribonuclease VII small subunit